MQSVLHEQEAEEGPLSPWWVRSVLIVLAVGFAGLIAITLLAYRHAPPIPAKVVDEAGVTVFTGDDIRDGQAVFLRYGLMNNGTIWGHGAYLGPDYSAEALHQIGIDVAADLSQEHFGRPWSALTQMEQAAIRAQVAVTLKTNRYDADSETLNLTAPEARAYRRQLGRWSRYFDDPAGSGGLQQNLVSDETELHQLSAFITWAAWVSVANRPGADFSYTNNFPHDPDVGNRPTPGALLWSALSLLVLLAGIAVVLLAFGRFDYLGWITRDHHVHPQVIPGHTSAGQRALVKFFVVVTLLFLMQTLIGGALAHYRIEPDDFYGFRLEAIFPSNLLRTWHLQMAIFWIATAYVAAGLFLARSLRNDEPRWLALAIARAVRAFGAGHRREPAREWAGHREPARPLVVLAGQPGLGIPGARTALAVLAGRWPVRLVRHAVVAGATARSGRTRRRGHWPGYSCSHRSRSRCSTYRRCSSAQRTNFTVVDTWRFWIIHLWVEGFFEFFATTVVALLFFQLGLTRRNTALRVIYLDAILYFLGGLIGTGHHWYFNGQSAFQHGLVGDVFGAGGRAAHAADP